MKNTTKELNYIRAGITNKDKASYAELELKYRKMLEAEADFMRRFPETTAFLNNLCDLYSQVGELAADIRYINGYHDGVKLMLDTVSQEM